MIGEPDAMAARTFSLIVPVAGHETAVARAVAGYLPLVADTAGGGEIVLVSDGRPGLRRLCEETANGESAVRAIDAGAGGWGRAVRAGIDAARGDILAFVNCSRTPASAVEQMLSYAVRNPEVVLRANRRTRDTRVQRLGSLLFNIECRLVLHLPAWDVNGTPKFFSRRHEALFALTRDDNLLDAEFALMCEREQYPVLEIPVEAAPLPGVRTRPDLVAAARMYLGVRDLRRMVA